MPENMDTVKKMEQFPCRSLKRKKRELIGKI